ncbi:Predicted hydrolase of the alpha/beta superfamily [Friedmanniella luteola]|uniref:Predicted hydrolase of the alpha/beta superfamily n=1 Tax=Friedmanniella luteola TaxID=546871 RepID=A0A1H1LI20_9ACTN|nr:alpha/beta hydrolase-fold protein [Friedmanniella luteola]SDR74204.1 Predicted hydrolase of the alpha/beta superfamily [Friedmanniella luteola]
MLDLLPAAVPGSESMVVRSALAHDDYLITVALPLRYEDEPDRLWPVVYVLDGNLHFGLVVDMVRFMNIRVEFCNELPDALVVGIGYPPSGTLSEMHHRVMHLRMRDFVLEREEGGEDFMQEHFPIARRIPSGNGLPFMQFIRQEVLPLVETRYRADPADRTLLGHSMGANFALCTLFREPGLFQRCVAASFDAILQEEQAFAERHSSLPVRLHLVWEGRNDEELAQARPLVDRLAGRGYQGLVMTQEVVSTTHCAMVPYAFQSGLTHVFS